MSRDRSILCVPSDWGAPSQGASLGPKALYLTNPNYWKSYTIQDLSFDMCQKEELVQGEPKYLSRIVENNEVIATAVHELLQKKHFPIVCSGDHSNAIGTIAGLRRYYPNAKIGAIWIDAHADLHSIYTTPSQNVHGMTLAAALAEDNLPCAVHAPNAKSQQAWNQLKGLGNIIPMLHPENLVFLGLRSYEKEEQALLDRHNIYHQSAEQVREKGLSGSVLAAKEWLKDCDVLYISWDIDSLDAQLVPGTGTPEDQGFSAEEIEYMLKEMLTWSNTELLEVTEVNPLLDHAGKTVRLVNQILQKVL